MPREIFHGNRWHSDARFFAPMITLLDGTAIFVRDCVSFQHPNLGVVKETVVKYHHQVFIRISMLQLVMHILL